MLVARRARAARALAREIAGAARVQVRCIPLDLARADAAAVLERSAPTSTSGSSSTTRRSRRVGAFLEIPLDAAARGVDVNVRGPLALAHRFGRRLAARGRGGIVLLSSLTAFQGSPFVATYGATKSFLLALAEGLWFELAPRGVDVLAVCAGATRTPSYLRQRAPQGAPGELEPDQVAREALARLGRGPSMIPGRFNRFASQLMRRLLPRRATIRLMGAQTKDLKRS